MRPAVGLLASLSLYVAACGGSGSTTAPPPTLTITLSSDNPLPPGTTVQATAILNGSPTSSVTWSTSNSAIATVTSSGLITGVSKGIAEIQATSGKSVGHTVVNVLGTPVAVHIYAGNNQNGAPGSQLPGPLCTTVTDAQGMLIVGMPVTYTVTSGGGSLAAPTAPLTANNGVAISGTWTLGSTPGAQTVVASVPGATSATFTATAR